MTLRIPRPAWLLVLCACGTSAGSAVSGDDTADAAELAPTVTACPTTVTCPAVPSTLKEGGGLVAADRCGFPLAVNDTQAQSFDSIINAYPLTKVTLTTIAGDLNRTGKVDAVSALPGKAPGVKRVFEWQSGDESVTYWTPQGVTGSFDGQAAGTVGGKKLVMVSWYYTMANEPGSTVDKGVRIAIADVTNPKAVTYRLALLVSPVTVAGKPSFASVNVHAGGLAWVGNRLYVPSTTGGFRVFDLSRILKLDGLADSLGPDAAGTYNAYGYAYAIPELERFTANPTCAPVFSFVSLDRGTNTLISGEYDADSIHGRLYRWPLDAQGALTREASRVLPSAAYFLGESHIQGGLSHGDRVWLSSSRPAGSAGELDRTAPAVKTTRLGWSNSPEDLAFDPQDATIWSLSEGVNARYVFEVALTSVQ
jgi:hypothetical protein